MNQPGLNQPGLNQPGLNQSGFNPSQFRRQSAYLARPGMTPPGLPPSLPPGLQPPGLNQSGLNQSGLNPNQPGVGQPGLGQPAPGTVPGFPGGVATSPDGSQQYPPIQFQPSLPQQQPVQQAPVQPTPVQQAPAQQAPFQQMPGQPQPGQGPFNPSSPGAPGAANPGLNIINQLLTTPRPAPSGIGPATNNQTIGGGIAGVASTFTGATIKSYGGRTDCSEWEFVYQLPQQAGMPQNGPKMANRMVSRRVVNHTWGRGRTCPVLPQRVSLRRLPAVSLRFPACRTNVGGRNGMLSVSMKTGSKRVVWLFLILGSLFGLFSVSSVRLAPAAIDEICCIAQRTPGVKGRATRSAQETRPLELSRASLASAGPVSLAPVRSKSLSVVWRDALYSRPPPVLSLT